MFLDLFIHLKSTSRKMIRYYIFLPILLRWTDSMFSSSWMWWNWHLGPFYCIMQWNPLGEPGSWAYFLHTRPSYKGKCGRPSNLYRGIICTMYSWLEEQWTFAPNEHGDDSLTWWRAQAYRRMNIHNRVGSRTYMYSDPRTWIVSLPVIQHTHLKQKRKKKMHGGAKFVCFWVQNGQRRLQ